MLASLQLYQKYARLVMHAFGVQRASGNRTDADLPAAMLEVSSRSSLRFIRACESI
jgi:hypothetical protein